MPIEWWKKLFLALILFGLWTNLNAQHSLVDSLDRVFKNAKNDRLRFALLSESASYYRNRDAELHHFAIKTGIATAIAAKDQKEKSKFIRELGIYYRKKGDLDSAVIQYQNALKIQNELNDSTSVNLTKRALANVHKAKGDYETAISCFNEVISYFDSKGEKHKEESLITQFNLAGVYINMREWPTADLLLGNVYLDPLTQKNEVLLRATAINLCATKQELNQLDKALSYAKVAEGLGNNPRSLADLNINMGTIYEKKKEYEKAQDHYLKALDYYETLNSNAGIILANNNLGNNSIQWGKYGQAEYYLLKAQNLLKENNNLKSLSHNQQMLAELYEKNGNLKKSLDFLKQNIELTDSILGIEKQEIIANLEIKFETEKVKRDRDLIEKKSEILALENQKNRNLFMASLLIMGLLLATGYFYISRIKAKKEVLLTNIELKETKRRLTLEKQYTNSELRALKAQMNPHFIFNALNSIQEYIISNNKTAASEYLGRFAHLIRRYLVQSDLEYISLQEEVDGLKTYLSLEALRFEDDFEYTIYLSETLEDRTYAIPTMLVQPFIENAITHGLLHKKGKRTLVVSFTKGEGNTLLCTVEDNGVGRDFTREIKQIKSSHHQSFSMAAIKERLRLFAEKTGEKVTHEIIDLKLGETAIGTKVLLTLPVKQQL